MKRLSTIEKGAVVLGCIFVVVGIFAIIQPTEEVVFHPGPERRALLGPNQPEAVSKRGSQIYGGLAVVLGAGLTCVAFYRGGK